MKTALVFVPGSRHSCKDQLERANGVFTSHEWRHEVVELEGRRLPAAELRRTIAFWGAAGCIDFCGEHAYPLPLAAYPAVAGTVSVYRDAHFIRELPNEDMELLLFSKKRSLVLAGWPHRPGSAVKPRPVKIRTDADEAVFVDLMGNPRPAALVGGVVTFDVGRYIGSLVLRGATKAEAIANPPLPTPEALKIRVADGEFPSTPQLVLDSPERYTSLAGYNPATEHLMWRGPADLSARYWFRRDGDALTIRAEVTDDAVHFSTTEAPHAGDVMALVFMVGGRRHFTWVKSADGHVYARTFSLAELGYAKGKRILFNTQVWDNDNGIVAEGYIGLSTDLNGEKTSEWAELEF